MLSALVKLARPQDWVKNIFVLLPLPFALRAGHVLDPFAFILGLFGFCLVNSAVYTLNDWFDAATDRLHPKKRQRPLAAGTVPVAAAALQFVVLALLGGALVVASGKPGAGIIAAFYFALNLLYTVWAKHVALLDVFLLASGFVLRVLLGCALVAAEPSPWLLLCTSSLALFLGFAKRRADLTDALDPSYRPSLRGYTKGFLDQVVGISAGVALLAYALYCIEVKNIFQSGREMASMPFVAYGILNYLRLVYVEGAGASPVDTAYRSWTMQLCGIGWIAAVTWSLDMW
jgi:4-hydroxybenzoate polyprenyltransferase